MMAHVTRHKFHVLLCALCAICGSDLRAQFGLSVQTNGDLRVHTNFHGATIQMPTQAVVFSTAPRVGTNDIATLADITAGTVTNGQWLGDLENYLPLTGGSLTGPLVAPAIQLGSATLTYTGGALRTTGAWQHYDAFDSYAMRRIYKVNDVAGSSSWGNLIEQYWIFGESAANHHWAMGVASNWSSPGYAAYDGIRWSPDPTYSNFVLQLSRNGQITAGPGGSFVGAHSGDGAGLTNIPGAAIVGGVGGGGSTVPSQSVMLSFSRLTTGSITNEDVSADVEFGTPLTIATASNTIEVAALYTTRTNLPQQIYYCASFVEPDSGDVHTNLQTTWYTGSGRTNSGVLFRLQTATGSWLETTQTVQNGSVINSPYPAGVTNGALLTLRAHFTDLKGSTSIYYFGAARAGVIQR